MVDLSLRIYHRFHDNLDAFAEKAVVFRAIFKLGLFFVDSRLFVAQIWNAAGFSVQAPSVLTRPTRRRATPSNIRKTCLAI